MKKFQSNQTKEIKSFLKRINNCHDGSIIKVIFSKKRAVDKKDGSLIYQLDKIEDFVNCDVEMVVILNSYEGAKTDQILILKFKYAKCFSFYQDIQFDYSDIYQLNLNEDNGSDLIFNFYSKDNVKFLEIKCKTFVCIEK